MAVTAADVKKLRQATDAPMMDCKKALTACDNDFDAATEWLKERGIAQSAKKADRVAAEGSMGLKVAEDFSAASLVEVNSETDFVAKNDLFKDFVKQTAEQVFANQVVDYDSLRASSKDASTYGDYFDAAVSKIGEKIDIRRITNFNTAENEVVNGYVHSDTRIGCLVKAKCDSAKTAEAIAPMLKNIAMHVSAMKPTTLSYKDFDAKFVAEETAGRIATIEKDNIELARLKKPTKNVPQYISMCQLTDAVLAEAETAIKATLKEQGKPEKIWDKIVPGQVARFIADNTTLDKELALLDQNFVMDDKLTIAQAISAAAKTAGGTAEITDFVRVEVGEGLEKKEDDFAAEVAAQMG